MQQPSIMGVDYGANVAGTTAIALLLHDVLEIRQSRRGYNTDEWLKQQVCLQKSNVLFIDAPLTLPKVYTHPTGASTPDYFYREADREVKGMSPMFIGGLTARAIKLKNELAATGTAVLETYPAQLATLLFPDISGYKKSKDALQVFTEALAKHLPHQFQKPENWHQFDALLAWLSGYRQLNKKAKMYGDATEGRIIV